MELLLRLSLPSESVVTSASTSIRRGPTAFVGTRSIRYALSIPGRGYGVPTILMLFNKSGYVSGSRLVRLRI